MFSVFKSVWYKQEQHHLWFTSQKGGKGHIAFCFYRNSHVTCTTMQTYPLKSEVHGGNNSHRVWSLPGDPLQASVSPAFQKLHIKCFQSSTPVSDAEFQLRIYMKPMLRSLFSSIQWAIPPRYVQMGFTLQDFMLPSLRPHLSHLWREGEMETQSEAGTVDFPLPHSSLCFLATKCSEVTNLKQFHFPNSPEAGGEERRCLSWLLSEAFRESSPARHFFGFLFFPIFLQETGNDDYSMRSIPWDLEDWSSCNKGEWARRQGGWIPHD